MTDFHTHDGDGLQFNSSIIVVLVGEMLECWRCGWKNAISLCRWLDILGLKGVCHLFRRGTELLFLEQLSMKPWNTLGYWVWDRSLNGLSSRLWPCGMRLAKSCRFWAGAPSNCQVDRQGTWNPILSSYALMGLSMSLMNLLVFITCSEFTKFANTIQGKILQ